MTKKLDNQIPILVVSCDAYQDLWRPFFHCFFKNWQHCPFPIYLVSNQQTYPDPRVKPILVGSDVDYSSNLIQAIGQIPQDWLIFWIDDRPPATPVQSDRLLELIELAQSKDAGYFRLIPGNPPALVDAANEIGELPKGSRYRVSMTVALWKKSTLLKILKAGETAWDIEKRGGFQRSNEIEDKFYALPINSSHPAPLVDVHLISKGQLMRQGEAFLRQEGILHYLEKRSKTPFWKQLYIQIYTPLWNLYYRLLWLFKRSGIVH